MKRKFTWFLALGALALAGYAAQRGLSRIKNDPLATIKAYRGEVVLYKSPTCGCCSLYVDYLRKQADLLVRVVKTDSEEASRAAGVPDTLRSCHTTKLAGYFIEGHVPLEAIERLLATRPSIRGLAMPGMPVGSPGMPGKKTEPFVIFAVQNDGSHEEFMTL